MGNDGLRVSPDACFDCIHKTLCLKKALTDKNAYIQTRTEKINRSYKAGAISFLERWAAKKNLDLKKKQNSDS
jgi:hypothetical protein